MFLKLASMAVFLAACVAGGALAEDQTAGAVIQDCADCPEMIVVPAGGFLMGSPEDEPEREKWRKGSESPRLKVTMGKPFAVGRFAVTVDQFEAFVREAGRTAAQGCYVWTGSAWNNDVARSFRSPGFEQDGSHPAVCVSWDDAADYAKWLSAKTGKAYRLLSEAEREYVARAGTTTPFWWGGSITPRQANYDGNSAPYAGGGEKGEHRRKTVPVKSFDPNPWGLYQVHGNVWEWTGDCWSDAYDSTPTDGSPNPGSEDWKEDGSGTALEACSRRVIRGGSWLNTPRHLRSAYRYGGTAGFRYNNYGFRVARTLTHE